MTAEPGVSNLVVLNGVARRPEGDAVQCDVLSSAANSVLRQLKALDDDRATPVAFGPYLAASGWLVLMSGHEIVQRYFTAFAPHP